MKKIKSLKDSTINQLIAALCLIGILSVVNCDNESDNEHPALQRVNLSARQIDDSVKAVMQTGTAYVKLTITTDKEGNTYAKYYKNGQDKSPTELKVIKFPIQTNGSIDAFFLAASQSGIKYWVQQFDLYDKDPDADTGKGTLKYSLSEKKDFTLKTGDSENNVIIDLIKNEPSDEGDSDSLKAPSFSVQTANKYSFIVWFLNALKQFFTKSY